MSFLLDVGNLGSNLLAGRRVHSNCFPVGVQLDTADAAGEDSGDPVRHIAHERHTGKLSSKTSKEHWCNVHHSGSSHDAQRVLENVLFDFPRHKACLTVRCTIKHSIFVTLNRHGINWVI